MKIKKETLLNALKAALLALFFVMLWGDMPVKVFAAATETINVTVQQGSSKEVTVSAPTSATTDHMEGTPRESEWAFFPGESTHGAFKSTAKVMISPGTNVAPGSYTLTVYWDSGNVSVVNITVVAKTSSDTPQPEENNSGNTDPNPHEHQFEWVTIRKATETEDGEAVYKCRICDAQENTESVGAMFVFNNNVVDKIKKTPLGGTVEIETYRWLSFMEPVLDALAGRPDVTLKLKFREKGYKGGNIIKVTIPAGANIPALKDENGYCGFANLVRNFGVDQ